MKWWPNKLRLTEITQVRNQDTLQPFYVENKSILLIIDGDFFKLGFQNKMKID